MSLQRNQNLISRHGNFLNIPLLQNDRNSWEKYVFSYLISLCAFFLFPLHLISAHEISDRISFQGTVHASEQLFGSVDPITFTFEGTSNAAFSEWDAAVRIFTKENDIASFDLRSIDKSGMYVRIQSLNDIPTAVELDGRSRAILSLIRSAAPQLKGKWLSLADNDAGILDKREMHQLQTYIIPEFIRSASQDLLHYVPSLDSQLIMRSWIIARSALVANSDLHIKGKLAFLDEYLEHGFTMQKISDGTSTFSISLSDIYKNTFVLQSKVVEGQYHAIIPAKVYLIGETLDNALSGVGVI